MKKRHLFLILAAALLSMGASPLRRQRGNVGVQNGNLTGAVLGHWSFEEAATTSYDKMDYLGFPLTWTGTTQAAGKVGNAGVWAGGADRRINLAPTRLGAVFAWPAIFTVSAWATESAGREGFSAILNIRSAASADMLRFGTGNSGGVEQLLSLFLDNAGTTTTQYCNFGATPSADTWHMYTVVVDTDGPTYQVMYEDGAAVASPGCTGLIAGAISTQTAGDYIVGEVSGSNWAGSIDELTIFNKALTAAEISCLYNSGNGRAWPWEGC